MPQPLKQGPGTATINGGTIACRVRGEGPALLLIMGLGVPGMGWDKQAYYLAKDFTTITYDSRGTGGSDPAPPTYTIEDMACDAIGVLDHLGIRRAHVVGISMGGFIAQTIALDYPDRVDCLVLCSTGFGGPEAVAASEEVLLDLAGVVPHPPEEQARRRLRINFGDAFIRDHPAECQSFLQGAARMPVHPDTRMNHLLAGQAFDRSADVGRITAPTLVIAGTDDILIPPENGRLLAARIPGAKLLLYEGAGHSFIVERTPDFVRDVRAFVRGEGGSG